MGYFLICHLKRVTRNKIVHPTSSGPWESLWSTLSPCHKERCWIHPAPGSAGVVLAAGDSVMSPGKLASSHPGSWEPGHAVLGRIRPISALGRQREMVLLLRCSRWGPKAWADDRALLPWGTQESVGLHPFGGRWQCWVSSPASRGTQVQWVCCPEKPTHAPSSVGRAQAGSMGYLGCVCICVCVHAGRQVACIDVCIHILIDVTVCRCI